MWQASLLSRIHIREIGRQGDQKGHLIGRNGGCIYSFAIFFFEEFASQPRRHYAGIATTLPMSTLRWRHNGCDSVSNHQPRECLLRRLIRRTSKKTSKLRVTGLCAGNSPETGEFPAQMASNAESVSIWWRHHEVRKVTRAHAYKCNVTKTILCVIWKTHKMVETHFLQDR